MANKTKDYTGYMILDQGDLIGFINLDKDIANSNPEITLVIEGIELELKQIEPKKPKGRLRSKLKSTNKEEEVSF